ncbi:hypothetical protein FHS82_001078 [Pseudochelatococcus lubricantis]|uniref:Tip attachment protein J domain-containing protein n=1 Tax=Pseudochelatococcus lubricantis TaxID=1538102 RepID=A0ABX0UWW8_9HYPH|nr:hypothetical protein [Pseudochelatococcus lubricantis]NIJ57252.1 hypothetical protein [Pseudochelatococcus lubricantis]
MTVYLIELEAHTGAGVETLHLASEGYATLPTDSPANTWYEPRVISPGSFQRNLFRPGATSGDAEIGYGEIVLANVDGGLDAWLDYGFDGRPVTIKVLPDADTAYAQARTVFRGSVEMLDSTRAWEELRVRIFDRRLDLDKPLQVNRYAGTTTSAGPTAEGNADLKDQTKPIIFGAVFNVPGIIANPYDLIYQWSDSAVQSITVYDAGVQLKLAANYSTITQLRNASIRPGQYATCLAQGMARLGGAPYKQITADVVEGGAGQRTAAQIARRVLLRAGMTTSDFNTATFTALDGLNNAECGIYIDTDMHTKDAISQVLASVGGWLAPDHLGVFQVGRVSGPGVPKDTFTEDDILGSGGIELLAASDDGRGIPIYRATVRYGRIWHLMQDGELGGCVSNDRRAYLSTEYREAKADNLPAQTKHKLSPEITVDTLLATQSAAEAEASRLLGLRGLRRDTIVITLPFGDSERGDEAYTRATAINLGDTITVQVPRFGYGSGRPFVVIGREDSYGTADDPAQTVKLTCWG